MLAISPTLNRIVLDPIISTKFLSYATDHFPVLIFISTNFLSYATDFHYLWSLDHFSILMLTSHFLVHIFLLINPFAIQSSISTSKQVLILMIFGFESFFVRGPFSLFTPNSPMFLWCHVILTELKIDTAPLGFISSPNLTPLCRPLYTR